ncbi:S1/P1 nuclease [Sphingobacterium siyangense]|uniref:S1/P1 nuclease n=1 Tax=Sphingobacterium siyangense TaxID=459529 RepID=UPI001963AC64|nr:S1/P1 nuclease [Sphingobacterium siyangense]QRY55471.1 S1/P1 nuclease [Sphingobacterium siyangense]
MKKIIISAIFLLIALKSFSWGNKGHAMVAQVAFSYLDENTKKNVLAYLDGMSIEEAANWMDEIKGDKTVDYMRAYHYANFPKGTKASDREGSNIVHVLNNTIIELGAKDKLTREEIKTRILFLFHLIGDLHQPLHVGYRIDKGGNTVQLNYRSQGTNLHSFWDSGIISSQNITLADCLNSQIYTPQELKAIRIVNIVSWSEESRALLGQVYDYGHPKVKDKYVEESAKTIRLQIQKAGIRLAAILQLFFKE